MRELNTFSIVAYDPDESAWGVAVASKFLASAAVVSWAEAGSGAVATQSLAKVSYGPDGLALMREGLSAELTLQRLLAADPGRDHRQVGLVDMRGNTAAYTGSKCHPYAGHLQGEGFTCQGNILTGADVLNAMAAAFVGATGELADRLGAALQAGNDAGGDKRGKQSAGVLVVRPSGGYGADNDRYLDLRVDDDPDPVTRLRGLIAMHHVYFAPPRAEDQLPIDEPLARELQTLLHDLSDYRGPINGRWDPETIAAFWKLVGSENLEERWSPEKNPDRIDRVALDYLRAKRRT